MSDEYIRLVIAYEFGNKLDCSIDNFIIISNNIINGYRKFLCVCDIDEDYISLFNYIHDIFEARDLFKINNKIY